MAVLRPPFSMMDMVLMGTPFLTIWTLLSYHEYVGEPAGKKAAVIQKDKPN